MQLMPQKEILIRKFTTKLYFYEKQTNQSSVNGDVKLKLLKGNIIVLGRKSENSLYDLLKVSFENNEVQDQQFAEKFIKSQFKKIN